MSVKQLQANESRFGLLQGIILLLGLATAAIHGILLNIMMGGLDTLFTLNGIGFLVLLAAYFLPQFSKYRNLVRWVLIAFTAVTIIAWIFMGARELLGYVTKLIEVGLIAALLVDARQ
jgi:ABC-type Na+ efflux pump permease subunit